MAVDGISDDPADFEEAIRAFRRRVPMPDHVWDALSDNEKAFGFKVAGAAQADLATQAWEAMDKAISQGTTLDEFKRDVGAQLEAAWGKQDPWRLETIFRTQAMAAYGAGRHEILSHPEVRKARPYLRFDAVNDSRTSDVCEALDGVIRPADDPFWLTRTPPLHFCCRSVLVPLSEEEAADEGVTGNAPDIEADEGFGRPPPAGGGADWEPDPKDYPAPIGEVLEDRLRGGPANELEPGPANDVEPEPVPEPEPAAPEPDRLVRELETSPIKTVHKRFGEETGNLNATLHVELETGQRGYYKPAAGEVYNYGETLPEGTYYKREAAGYQLDRALGVGMVPATVVREGPDGIGSFQIEHAPAHSPETPPKSVAGLPTKAGGKPKAYQVANREAFQRMRVYDIIAGNMDRHVGNWLRRYNAAGELVPAPIDHGMCFPKHDALDWIHVVPERGNPSVYGPLEPSVKAIIDNADFDVVAKALKGAGLEPEAVRGTLGRLDLLKRRPDLGAYGSVEDFHRTKSARHTPLVTDRWNYELGTSVAAEGYSEEVNAAMERAFPEWTPTEPVLPTNFEQNARPKNFDWEDAAGGGTG